jgi:hypothetical protein
VGETSQNDDQQGLSELQRKRPDCRRHADLAPARFAVGAFRILVPCWLPIVEGQATNMSAMKSNKLAKRAHARLVARWSVRVVWSARAHRFERGLPEQAINKRDRRSMVKDEPVISRQRHAELAQVRQIAQTIA